MTNNPMTRGTQEADDEPMVMVNLNGSSDDDERTPPAPEPEPETETETARNGQECVLGGETSDSEDEAPIPDGDCCQCAPAHEPGLPPVPTPRPSPTIGFQNLVLAIQIALEAADATQGTAIQQRRRASALVRAMVDDDGAAPGAPTSPSGFHAFLASEALEGVVDLVREAARGPPRRRRRHRRKAPRRPQLKAPPTCVVACLQALKRWALSGRKK